VRGQGGTAAAVSEYGFNGFHYKVEREGGIEEVWMVLPFLYHGAREGVPWQCVVWRHRPGQRWLGRSRWAASASGSQVLMGRTLW
jgi:hypothetical protein